MAGILDLAYWDEWQKRVEATLPYFCLPGLYADQTSQSPEDVAHWAEIADQTGIDPTGKDRDALFGGKLWGTEVGLVTKMWVDGCLEVDWLKQRVPLAQLHVLDVGCGYGRLAVPMSFHANSVDCVDACPVSEDIARFYTRCYGNGIMVLPGRDVLEYSMGGLAVNVHSWSECRANTVGAWATELHLCGYEHLFTVTRHGDTDFPCFEGEDMRAEIEAHYDIVDSEHYGLSGHRHTLWEAKR